MTSRPRLVMATTHLIRFALSLMVAGLYFCLGQGLSDERMRAAAGALGNTSGTMLGFLVTATAIVTALTGRRLVKNMVKTGHYTNLVDGTFGACVLLLVTTIMSRVAIFMSNNQLDAWLGAMIFLSSLATIYLLEAGYRFAKIVKHVS